MMTKEQFVGIINAIKKEDKKYEEIEEVLSKYSDTYIIFNRDLEAYIVKELDKYFGDSDNVSWWLYEDVEKVIYEGDKKIDVSTPEKLYDNLLKDLVK